MSYRVLGMLCWMWMGCGDATKDSGDTSNPADSDAAVGESDDLDADADEGMDSGVDGGTDGGGAADIDDGSDTDSGSDGDPAGDVDIDGAAEDADGSDGPLLDDGLDADEAADDDSSSLPIHRSCSSDEGCDINYFCGVECWTGDCGEDESIPMGTRGAYCQPCIECHAPTDAVTGSCDTCGGPAYDMDVDAGEDPDDEVSGDDSSDLDSSLEPDGSTDGDSLDVILPSSRWRVVNVDAVEDHWNVSEMVFYSDRECTVSMSGMVSEAIVSSTEVCSDPATVLHDGACNFAGHCTDGNWANQSALSGAGEVWAGYALTTTASVRCVSVCQGSEPIHRLSQLRIEKSDDEGESWDLVQTVTTDSTDAYAPTLFILD